MKLKPFLTRDPEGLQAWRDFQFENPTAFATGPAFLRDAPNAPSVALTAPTASVQFEGLANVDNVSLRGFGVLPPDDGLAVGPNDVFQMVNIIGRITSKSGASPTSFGLNSFFQVAAGFSESDPRVIYDASSGRWFGSYVQFSGSAASSSILLAVSATSDPRATFCVYRIGNPTSETFLQDFPMLGVSDDKVVLSYNGFALPSEAFVGAGYYVLNKADLIACGGTVRAVRVAPNPFRATIQPAQSLSSTSNLQMAMHDGGSSLTLLTVSGVPGVSAVTETATSRTIRSWGPAPSAQQAGSAVLLDTGDDRVLSVAWQNNSLWLAGNEGCLPAGDTVIRSCLRLIEFRTDSSTINQDMTFGTNGEYYSYPALRPDSSGNVYVVFTRSSSTAFPSVRITGRQATDPLNTLQASTEIRSGGGAQTSSTGRMGDYSAAAVDPSVSGTVWVAAEYIRSTATANWGTWISKLSFGAPPTTFALAVTKAGIGSGTVTSTPTGITCGTTCSASFVSGTGVTLTATPAPGSTFAGWSGACSGSGTCSVTMTAATAVTATFNTSATTFALSVTKTGSLAAFGTVTSSPSGINCGSTCSANYASGTAVTLTASPASFFAGWSGPCSGSGSCTVTMNAATTVTATFAFSTGTNTLTVTKAGTGSGTVTSSPAGISCGTTCSASFASNTVVALTASADTGSTFAGWSGACSGTGSCSVTPTAATSVTATFTAAATVPLSVTKAGTGSGTVTSSPAGISCGPTCSASFASGTRVALTASPAAGSTFAGWSGACSGTGSCSVTMNAAPSVTATFTAAATVPLTVTKAGTGSGTVTSSPAGISCGATCSASFASGTRVTLTATSTGASIFVGWNGTCSGTGPCTVTMTASQAVVAIFLGF